MRQRRRGDMSKKGPTDRRLCGMAGDSANDPKKLAGGEDIPLAEILQMGKVDVGSVLVCVFREGL